MQLRLKHTASIGKKFRGLSWCVIADSLIDFSERFTGHPEVTPKRV
jgi:hypothetical protein